MPAGKSDTNHVLVHGSTPGSLLKYEPSFHFSPRVCGLLEHEGITMNRKEDNRTHTYVLRNGEHIPPVRSFDPFKTLILTLVAILLLISMVLPGHVHIGSGLATQDIYAGGAPVSE